MPHITGDRIGDRKHGLIPRAPQELIERLNRAESPKGKKKLPEEHDTTSVHDSDDFWTINNVSYRNGVYQVDFSKSLIGSGNEKKQDDWADYSEQARKRNGFYTGDMPLHHAIFASLYSQRDSPQSEEARKFIQKSMREYFMTTLTRILYQPKGKDKIIHDYKTSDEHSLEENISGPDREIKNSDSPALKALLGTDDIQKISEIYKWLNQTPTCLWRIKKPSDVEERIAVFIADSIRVYLNCNRYPDVLDRSFGVRARKN